MILKHADNLSSTLQHKSMPAAEGQQVAAMTVSTLESVRSDESSDLFWEKVIHKATALKVNKLQLPRCRKCTRRYEGLSGSDFPETPKAYFRQCCYEALDLIICCIQNRFDQPGYKIYHSLETQLMKACNQEEWDEDLQAVLLPQGRFQPRSPAHSTWNLCCALQAGEWRHHRA